MVFLSVLATVIAMSRVAGLVASSDVSCLEYVTCYKEVYLHQSHMEIHHYDHSLRTASSCLPVCLERRPSTQLVMAKIIDMNERLVCGCGDNEALGSGNGSTEDLFACNRCPEGTEKCGGLRTVSIYRVKRSGECRLIPTNATTTTTTTKTTTTTTEESHHDDDLVIESSSKVHLLGYMELSSSERAVLQSRLQSRSGNAVERCLAFCVTQDSRQRYGFMKPIGDAVFCGCG